MRPESRRPGRAAGHAMEACEGQRRSAARAPQASPRRPPATSRHAPARPRPRGLSLVESMVAILVAALAALGIVGSELTLRRQAEDSRARTQALQQAQAWIERQRAGVADAADASEEPQEGTPPGAAHPTLQARVSEDPTSLLHTLVVDAHWADRAGRPARLRLATLRVDQPPQLAGSLLLPSAVELPGPAGRHATIPRDAVDAPDGTAHFTPPGAAGTVWQFDRRDGVIVAVCQGPTCTAGRHLVLSGHVRIAAPDDARVASAWQVALHLQGPAGVPPACATVATAEGLGYHCAVPLDALGAWSGRSLLTGLALAASRDDADATRWRVCRVTPVRDTHPVVDPPRFTNRMHPLDYVAVTESLTDQNFLVRRAGDGLQAYPCPGDNPSTAHVDETTWHHQPSD